MVFRRLKFKIWFLGVLHQNVLPGKTCKKYVMSLRNIGGLYLQLVANTVHSFNLFLYYMCKSGLGVKNHILKISQKCMIFNMTILHLFRMFCDSLTQFWNIIHHLPPIPNPTHRKFLYIIKYFCMLCLVIHFDTRMSKQNLFKSVGGPWAYFLWGQSLGTNLEFRNFKCS